MNSTLRITARWLEAVLDLERWDVGLCKASCFGG